MWEVFSINEVVEILVFFLKKQKALMRIKSYNTQPLRKVEGQLKKDSDSRPCPPKSQMFDVRLHIAVGL
jgi:hypothetical protein